MAFEHSKDTAFCKLPAVGYLVPPDQPVMHAPAVVEHAVVLHVRLCLHSGSGRSCSTTVTLHVACKCGHYKALGWVQ